ncbi:MAG: hypothetical protein RLZZ440_836 [Planctomycetota bacterium]
MTPPGFLPRRWPSPAGAVRFAGLLLAMSVAAGGTAARGQTGLFDWTTAAALYPGILHADLTLTSPDPLQVNCLRIDTLAPGLSFYTTARASSWQPDVRETILQTTPSFITTSRTTSHPLVAAVNANLFVTNGSAADLTGFAVSNGTLVSPGVADGVGRASFSVTTDGVPSILDTVGATAAGDSWTAVSGIYQCLADGSPRLSGTDRAPRTGIGVSQNTRYVYLMTIDGRSASSVGVTNTEVGEWLASFGAWDGIYMDGGGSTTMAWWNPAASGNNKTQVLNTPSDGSPRSVGNNVGVYFSTPVYTPGELWWAGDGVRGGSGSWTPTGITWRDGAIYGPDVAWNSEPPLAATAVFAGTAGTVVPAGEVIVETIDVRTTGYRLGSTTAVSDLSFVGTPSLTLADAATLIVTARLAGAAPALVGGGSSTASLIVLRPIGGDSTLTGTARLSGNLTVELGGTTALGTAAVEVPAGSGLDLKADQGVFTNDLVLAGTGSTGLGGAVRFSNTGTLAGGITLTADATIRAGGLFSVTATLAGELIGPGELTVTGIGSSRVVLTGQTLHTGGTRITAGTLAVGSGGRLTGGVTVAESGRLTLPTEAAVSVEASSLAIALGTEGGLFDLGSGRVDVAPGGMSLATMLQAIFAGRGTGSWQGTSGITSSVAAASSGTRTLGYLAAADGSVTVAFASAGDTNLNGQVDAFDLVSLAAGGRYGSPQAAFWNEGDFNYDGVFSVLDLIAIQSAGTYGGGSYLPTGSAVATAVPEPAVSWLPAVMLAAFAAVRRQRPWLLAAALLVTITPASAAPLTLHVAVDGNDAWTGTAPFPAAEIGRGPLATLAAARDRVRAALAAASPPDAIEVVIHGGTHVLAEPLALSAADSGTPATRVTWRAAPGERVVLSGGRRVGGFAAVAEPATVARIPQVARPHVLQADLKAAGVADAGTFAGSDRRLEVFDRAACLPIARWPNEGFATIGELLGDRPMTDGGLPGNSVGKFTVEIDRLPAWQHEPDGWLFGYFFWDWSDSRQRIKAVDPAAHSIELEEPHTTYRSGQRFYGFNMLCELDRPGEWCVDRERGILYLWPLEGFNGEVTVTLLDHLLVCEDVARVNFEGLLLEGSRGTLVTITGGEQVTIGGCRLRNAGGWGVDVQGGREHAVLGCDLHDLGAGGVRLVGGDRPRLVPAGHRSENNHIHHYARLQRTYRPAVEIQGVGNRAAHNLIHDAPHNGILLGGNDHEIECNHIHDVCQETGDVGAFYMGRDWSMRGTVIRHNRFEDIEAPGRLGAMGVYLDDCASGITIVGNFFLKAGRSAFMGGGRDNVVENNIFIDGSPAVELDARGIGWFAPTVVPGGTMRQKLDEMPWQSPTWTNRYPEIARLLEEAPEMPRNNIVRRNISVGGTWATIEPAAGASVTFEHNLVDTDPRFVDAAAGDYRLADDSPAWGIGFRRIPLERIGLEASLLRAQIPRK